jgi:predicted amidophosphoribosyltransferase
MSALPGRPDLPPGTTLRDLESPDPVCRECGRVLTGDDGEDLCRRCAEEARPLVNEDDPRKER